MTHGTIALRLDALSAEAAVRRRDGPDAAREPGYDLGYSAAMADAARFVRSQDRSQRVSATALANAVALLGDFLPGWSDRERYKRAADLLHAAGIAVEGWEPDGANRLAAFHASRRANEAAEAESAVVPDTAS